MGCSCWLLVRNGRILLQKWRCPPQNSRDKSFFLRKLTGFVLHFWIFDHTLSCFVYSSLHRCLSCTVPKFHLGPLRLLSNIFIHSIFLPVLSKTQLHEAFSLHAGARTLTLTTSIGIWHGAGATRGVTSPTAHRGIWHSAGAARSWLHSPSCSKSFAMIEKRLNSTKVFYLGDKRNAQRWQWNTNRRQKSWCVKGMMPRNIAPLICNCPGLVDFLWFLINCNWNLSISLHLCATADFSCSWFVVKNGRIPLQSSNLLLRFEKLKNKSLVPCELNWFSAYFSLFTLTLGYFAWSSLPWFHCALWSTFGLPRIPSLSHSASPCLLHLTLFCPRYTCRRWSLAMLVPREKSTVPQLTGVYGIVRVPGDLDCTLVYSRRLLPRSKWWTLYWILISWNEWFEWLNHQNDSLIGYSEEFVKNRKVNQRWIKISWHPQHTISQLW